MSLGFGGEACTGACCRFFVHSPKAPDDCWALKMGCFQGPRGLRVLPCRARKCALEGS